MTDKPKIVTAYDSITDLKRVDGYSILAPRMGENGAVIGAMIRRVILRKNDDEEEFADFNLIYADVAFLTNALARILKNDAETMASLKNFDALFSEDQRKNWINYFDRAILSLESAKHLIEQLTVMPESKSEQAQGGGGS
jgi:hypothetical protein